MTKEEQARQEFCDELEHLVGTMINLNDAWNSLCADDMKKTWGGKYPFPRSFDEMVMEVLDWQEDLTERLWKE